MITQMRRHLKSKGFKTAVWVFLIVIAGGGIFIQLFLNLFERSQWILNINGTSITQPQFEQRVFIQDEYISMIRSRFGSQAPLYLQFYGLNKGAKIVVKEQLIRETLLNEAVRQSKIDLSPEYIVDKISDPNFVSSYLMELIPPSSFVSGQGIDFSRLYAELKRFNITESEFETSLTNAIKRYIFIDQLLSPAAYVPRFVQQHEYQARFGPRTVSYVKVPYSAYMAHQNSKGVSSKELELFFEQETNKGVYRIPEMRQGTVWRFDACRFGLSIPEKKIEDYYNRHKSDFVKNRAQVQVRRILLEILDPTQEGQIRSQLQGLHSKLLEDPSQFAQFAKEHSQDAESASQGGLLPYFTKGDIGDIAFEKAAFLLTKDGAISPVTKTQTGYELIQRVSRKPQVYRSLTEVKDDIRDILLQKKFEQRFVGDTQVVVKSDDQDRWADFVKQRAPKTYHVSSSEGKDTNDASAVQKLSALKKGGYKVYLDGQVGVVLCLDEIAPAHLPPLDSIKKKVLQDLRTAQATVQLENKLEESVLSGNPLEVIAKQEGLKVEVITLNPQDSEALERLKKQGIPVDSLLALEKKEVIVKAKSDNNGYLARLDEIKDVDLHSLNEKEIEAFDHQLARDIISYTDHGFIASLYRDATIKVNNSMVQAIQ